MRVMRAVLGGVAAGLAMAGALMAAPANGGTADRAVGQCTNAELKASYHGTDAGLSHRHGRMELRNVSGHACRTGGYGGLSYVGGGNGTQIGVPADRKPSEVRSIVVRPGQKVVSVVSETDAGVYSRRECRPAHVDGFRVYVPNETRAQYVRHPTTGCRNDDVHLLTHKAYRRP